MPVSRIGSASTQTARSEASVLISPRIDSIKRWKLQALVLPQLTDYQSPPEMVYHDLSFVSRLQLADPQLSSREHIEMVLGVDAYTKIILSDLRKTPDEQITAQVTALGWIVTGSSVLGHSSPHVKIQANASVITMQCLKNQIALVYWSDLRNKRNSHQILVVSRQKKHYAKKI